jgi:hypothetical protein
MAVNIGETGVFKGYMRALAEALRQELPDVSDSRAEFAVDGIPYVFTADPDGPALFACAVIGALPRDPAARGRVFAELLHAQFCFSQSCGFCFGVDAEDSFVLLQSLVNPECVDERHYVALAEKFVQTANVWSKRLAELGAGDGGDGEYGEEAGGGGTAAEVSGFAIQV